MTRQAVVCRTREPPPEDGAAGAGVRLGECGFPSPRPRGCHAATAAAVATGRDRPHRSAVLTQPPLGRCAAAAAGKCARSRGLPGLGGGREGTKAEGKGKPSIQRWGTVALSAGHPPPYPQDQSARQLAPFPSPQPPLRRRSALFHPFYLPLRHPPLPPSHTPWHGISPSGCGASPSGWPPAWAARPLPRGAPPPPPRARGRHYRSCRRRHFRCRRAPPCQASARRQPPRGATTHPRRRQRDRPPVWRRRRPRGCPPQRRC